MAKVMINGIEFEGTPSELLELVSLSKVNEKSKELPNKLETRKYRIGDIVRITRYQNGPEIGELREVTNVRHKTVDFADGFAADFDAIELYESAEERF